MTDLLDKSIENSLEEVESNIDKVEQRTKHKENNNQRPKFEQDANNENETIEEQSEEAVDHAEILTQVQIHHIGSNELDGKENVTQASFCFG